MILEEEVWNIAKQKDVLVLKYYTSFADFKRKRYLAILEQKDSV
jgi:hypothetical protein